YLEALRENRLNRDNILDIARSSLETLGYWPLPEVQATIPVATDGADDADAATAESADDVEHNVAAFIDRSIDQVRTPQAPVVAAETAPAHAVAPVVAKGEGGAGGFE